MNHLWKLEEMEEVILLSHNELRFREGFFILYQAKWKKTPTTPPPKLSDNELSLIAQAGTIISKKLCENT